MHASKKYKNLVNLKLHNRLINQSCGPFSIITLPVVNRQIFFMIRTVVKLQKQQN